MAPTCSIYFICHSNSVSLFSMVIAVEEGIKYLFYDGTDL
jgi:hypothetical protein